MGRLDVIAAHTLETPPPLEARSEYVQSVSRGGMGKRHEWMVSTNAVGSRVWWVTDPFILPWE